MSIDTSININTKLFEKDSNAYMYLRKKSNHPYHTKQKIAYGLALRAKRICSEHDEYEKSKKDIKNRLVRRGHAKEDVEKQLQLADQ